MEFRVLVVNVVVVSTDRTKPQMHRMFTPGAKRYVAKPFPPERLRVELEGSFGGGPCKRMKFRQCSRRQLRRSCKPCAL